MALVRIDDKDAQSSWTKRDKRATQHKIPGSSKKSIIDYGKLRELISIPGLQGRDNATTTEEAHRQFMRHYKSIFVQPEKKTGLPNHVVQRRAIQASHDSLTSDGNSKSVLAGETTLAHKPDYIKPRKKPEEEPSHDVRDHMTKLHKQRRSEDPKSIRASRIKTLRRLLRKLPFERNGEENDQIFEAVKHFRSLAGQVTIPVLKELCVVAQLDSWKDEDITVFGNTGLHMVLRGSVQPYSHPYMKHRGVKMEFVSPTPEPQFEPPKLGVGECFGTLEKVEGRDPNSRILTVTTLEPNCDFLKISTSDYGRVIEQIRNRDQTEKMNLMQSCKTYRLWSKQPLAKMADLIQWETFPPNTVLVSEGYQAPFVAIIKSGECHVLRQVDVLHTMPNGTKEKRLKQVVMGKLGAGTGFGEVSIIGNEPMTCSIVTATNVELACVEPGPLHGLDGVTQQLLLQSSERTYANLTQEDIHNEYIEQELKREWNEFKHNIVMESINKKGIRPGYGKWCKE